VDNPKKVSSNEKRSSKWTAEVEEQKDKGKKKNTSFSDQVFY